MKNTWLGMILYLLSGLIGIIVISHLCGCQAVPTVEEFKTVRDRSERIEQRLVLLETLIVAQAEAEGDTLLLDANGRKWRLLAKPVTNGEFAEYLRTLDPETAERVAPHYWKRGSGTPEPEADHYAQPVVALTLNEVVDYITWKTGGNGRLPHVSELQPFFARRSMTPPKKGEYVGAGWVSEWVLPDGKEDPAETLSYALRTGEGWICGGNFHLPLIDFSGASSWPIDERFGFVGFRYAYPE